MDSVVASCSFCMFSLCDRMLAGCFAAGSAMCRSMCTSKRNRSENEGVSFLQGFGFIGSSPASQTWLVEMIRLLVANFDIAQSASTPRPPVWGRLFPAGVGVQRLLLRLNNFDPGLGQHLTHDLLAFCEQGLVQLVNRLGILDVGFSESRSFLRSRGTAEA